MCDITQSCVCVPVLDCTSAIISKFFMQDCLPKFYLCFLIVLDDYTPLKGEFISMCDAIYLRYDIVAKRNHKMVSVERFHRFEKSLNHCFK